MRPSSAHSTRRHATWTRESTSTKRFSTNPYGWLRWVFDQFDLPPGARVLEVGCGTGQL
jgi:cyclopropane fatty-acyl-phospholipid synthase-like methyltransferase